MVNKPSLRNQDKAIDSLRNILHQSQGKVLDEALTKKLDLLCRSLESNIKGRSSSDGGFSHDHEIGRSFRNLQKYKNRERRQNDNIMDVIEAGLCLLDKDLKIVWANKTISDWLDLKESPLGRNCKDIFHCNKTEVDNCQALQVYKGGKGHVIETWLTTKTNKRLCVQRIAIPVTNKKGAIENVLVRLEDVTESEKSLHWLLLLQKLGEKMQGTLHLDKLLHLVLTCVTTGHAFGFNRAMLFLVDKEENVIRGKLAVGPTTREEATRIWEEISNKYHSLEEILDALEHDNDFDKTFSLMTRQIRYPLTETNEVIVTCAQEKRPILVVDAAQDPRLTEEFKKVLGVNEFVCVPLIVRNETIGVIVADNIYTKVPITEDLVNVLTMFANQAALAIENAETCKRLEDKVTQLTTTQRRLIRAEKFAAIGSMASYIAHEIRNPLVTIGGFTRSLSRFHFEDPKIKTNLDIILNEVIRLEKILNNITHLSKPSIPKKATTQICEIVDNTCSLMENYFKERNINFSKEISANIPPILVVSSQISQVLFNTLMNAVESMPDGGDLTIRVRLEEESIGIDIIDTGTGMPTEELQSIFDPFYTTKLDGSGIGLAISRKIIEEHGGKVSVNSECGKGTTMSLFLPIH